MRDMLFLYKLKDGYSMTGFLKKYQVKVRHTTNTDCGSSLPFIDSMPCGFALDRQTTTDLNIQTREAVHSTCGSSLTCI